MDFVFVLTFLLVPLGLIFILSLIMVVINQKSPEVEAGKTWLEAMDEFSKKHPFWNFIYTFSGLPLSLLFQLIGPKRPKTTAPSDTMIYKLDTKILFGFCIILSIIAIQSGDYLTLILGNLLAFSIWYFRRKRHNAADSRYANNLTVNHVTNVFNDSVISGDINIGNTIRDENQNE